MYTITLDEVNSTNLYAKENLNSMPDKTVIIAKRQSAGRGRLSRTWIDLGGENLFMSIILKPSSDFLPEYANLTQYLSVVLCRVLDEYGLTPCIKWPNDVQINGGKIAGILSETAMQGNLFKGIVLGIGVNVNAKKDDLKQIKDRAATALNIELDREYEDKKLFTEKLLNKFFENYDEFLKQGFKSIRDEYLKRTNFLGKAISVQLFNRTETGIGKSINDKGELILMNKDKELILTMGDIYYE